MKLHIWPPIGAAKMPCPSPRVSGPPGKNSPPLPSRSRRPRTPPRPRIEARRHCQSNVSTRSRAPQIRGNIPAARLPVWSITYSPPPPGRGPFLRWRSSVIRPDPGGRLPRRRRPRPASPRQRPEDHVLSAANVAYPQGGFEGCAIG